MNVPMNEKENGSGKVSVIFLIIFGIAALVAACIPWIWPEAVKVDSHPEWKFILMATLALIAFGFAIKVQNDRLVKGSIRSSHGRDK